MSRVDFYKLTTADVRSRRVMACRLTEKAREQGHRVFVYTASEADSQALDDLLWTFRKGSFVPHAVIPGDGSIGPETPVLIGCILQTQDACDVLINLTAEIPPGYDRFARILELIDQDEEVRRQGRVRYRSYRDAGHELHDRDIS